MIRRLTVCLILATALGAALTPHSALAHGPALRGSEIDTSTTLKYHTGNCVCDQHWYTLGLQKGQVKVALTVTDCTLTMGPSCGANLFFYQGLRLLKFGAIGCSTKSRRCGLSTSIDTRVTQPGVYYLLIKGSGAVTVNYTLHIRGNVYPLHCRTYC